MQTAGFGYFFQFDKCAAALIMDARIQKKERHPGPGRRVKRARTSMKPNYRRTQLACYLGFITQAISANFAPLLFMTF